MYADYSTDAVSGYDDKERSKASSPPSGTAVSYPSRSTSFSPTNGTATYSPSLRSQPLHAGSQSQSPKDPLSLRAATPPSQPLSVSPYSGSPRPSDEIQLPPTQPQSHPPSQPHRRDSLVAPSVNSERIITQYAPTELGSVDEGPNAGFDESVLRALCDLDVGTKDEYSVNCKIDELPAVWGAVAARPDKAEHDFLSRGFTSVVPATPLMLNAGSITVLQETRRCGG